MTSFTQIPAKNKQGYKWICVKDGPPDPVTGKRNQIKRRADTKKAAESRVDDIIKKLKEHGIDRKKVKKLPFSQVAEDWVEQDYSKTGVKDGSIRIRKKEIKILNRFFGAVNIDKITFQMVQGMINSLDEEGYEFTTIEGVSIAANMIFKYAIREKYIVHNPRTGTKIPIKKRTVEEIENDPVEEKYLTTEELNEFLQATRIHGLPDDVEMFHLLAFTGMRPGELCVLKETDFNFETSAVRITKTMYNPDNNMAKYQLETPKTEGSIRTPHVDEVIMNLMKAFIRTKAKLRLAIKNFDPDYVDEKFVFCNDKGYPIIQKTILRRMTRILRKTNIKKQATPHIFRHTHISMLAEAEVDLVTIMKRVGHDDPKTTLKVYTHVTEKMQRRAGEKVNKHFADILSKVVLQGM